MYGAAGFLWSLNGDFDCPARILQHYGAKLSSPYWRRLLLPDPRAIRAISDSRIKHFGVDLESSLRVPES